MIEYQMNIREESFGATILNLKNGQREYLNTSELKKLLEFGIFPNNSCIKKDDKNLNIKYIKNFNKKNHFSFADIAYIEITHECNLRCKHCLNNSGNKIPNQLNDDEIFNLIIEFSKAGMQEIRFTGGEPLVHNKVYEFISLAHKLGMYTSIGTNGTLITIEEAKKLKLAGLTLTHEDYNFVKNSLKNELKDKYIIGHYLNENEQINYRINLPFNFIKGCKAGQRSLIILPNGDISLCGFLAAQGFNPIGNIRNVKNWIDFWNDMHSKDYLKELRANLNRYNSIENVQKTNCLAYVQRMLTLEKISKKENNI